MTRRGDGRATPGMANRQARPTPAPGGAVDKVADRSPSIGVRAAILAVQAFRVIRFTLFPVRSCRFVPTCTDYAIEALRVHGILQGASLAVRRVARCHPFNPGGIDPVPRHLP